MIVRAHRFHGYNALRHVYNNGRTVRGQLLVVKYARNPRRSSYRAAVVVSRKVDKSAVIRGRIRRRIYEIIRLLEPRITGPYDIVVTVFSSNMATMPAAGLQKMVEAQLQRAGIIAASVRSENGSAPASEQGGLHAIVDKKERPA